MGKWTSFGSGCGGFAFGIGFEMADVTHQAIGYSLMMFGAVMWAVSAYLFYRDRRKVQQRTDPESVTQPLSARELTETEVLQLRSMWSEMLWTHGHVDRVGLLDDLLHGRLVNGPCWLCGEPRFREGKEHGEVSNDHNG